MKKKRGKTAEGLALEFGSPEFVAREKARYAEIAKFEKQERKEQKPLLRDLKEVGIQIETVWDLVNSSASYAPAIPVLIDHLSRPYSDGIRQGIARALTVKEAKGIAAKVLIEEFSKSPDKKSFGAKWAMGNALTVTGDEESVEDIIVLALDKKHGAARSELPLALAKFPSERVKMVLTSLLNDKDIASIAKKALEKVEKKLAKRRGKRHKSKR